MSLLSSLLRVSSLASILTLAGCTGVIEADSHVDDQRPGAGPSSTRSPTGDPGRAGGGDGTTTTVAAVPGSGGLRRLTTPQYWNAIDALLGSGLPRSVLDP